MSEGMQEVPRLLSIKGLTGKSLKSLCRDQWQSSDKD